MYTSSTSSRFVGTYRLGPLLGRGGTSEVYAAEHVQTRERVAVKLLRPELAFDEAMVTAFIDEAARTRTLLHRNVIRVLDFGTDAATGCCYLVMEHLPGESLAARIARSGPLPEHLVRALGAAIADGMQLAHSRGVVHRDLKPGNIMLRGEEPVVIDFGVAKSLGAGSAVVTSRRVGTLTYMAPEQLQGLITPAIDIWALGAVLFEAATGRAPFEDFHDGRLPQLIERAPIAPVSPPLAAIIARCLEREPQRRPASMTELAALLRGDATPDAGERMTQDADAPPVVAVPPTQPTRRLAPRRSPWPWVLAALGAAALGVTAAMLMPSDAATAAVTPAPADAAALAPEIVIELPPDAAVADEPALVELDLRSVPPGADVLVDGAPRGTTPTTLRVPPATPIEVRLRGHQPRTLVAERTGLVELALVPTPRKTTARKQPGRRKTTTREGLD